MHCNALMTKLSKCLLFVVLQPQFLFLFSKVYCVTKQKSDFCTGLSWGKVFVSDYSRTQFHKICSVMWQPYIIYIYRCQMLLHCIFNTNFATFELNWIILQNPLAVNSLNKRTAKNIELIPIYKNSNKKLSTIKMNFRREQKKKAAFAEENLRVRVPGIRIW